MKTLSILQNSKEWDELRAKKLGASDVNIIMGVSEFMTPYQLWMQKTGRTKRQESENFIQNKGHKKEVKARARFEFLTDREWPPIVAIHSDYDFFMASLDGYNEELGENLEIKFFGKEDFENLVAGKVPDKYFPQIQAQMAVTGAEVCHLAGINEEDRVFPLQVPIDVEYIQNKMYPAIFAFQECIEKGIAPELCDRDVIDLSGNEKLKELLEEYESISSSKKAYEEKEEELKKAIFAIAKAPCNVCNGIKVTNGKPSEKKEVDIAKIAEDFKVDLAKYTTIKVGSGQRKITFPKKEKVAEQEKVIKEKPVKPVKEKAVTKKKK